MSPLQILAELLENDELSEPLRLAVKQHARFCRRVLEDELAFQHLGSRLDCGLLVVDERGQVTYLNDRLGELLRAPRSGLVGQRVASWLAESEQTPFLLRLLQRRDQSGALPYRMRCRRTDGSVVCVSLLPFPRHDPHGVFLGSFAMVFEQPAQAPVDGEADLGGAAAPAATPAAEQLSARERQIVELLLSHQAIAEIGRSCTISPHTVRNHIKAIYRKLGVHSRAELMRRFHER